MKTKRSFSSLLAYVVNYLLCAALVGGPSLSLAAGEVVKSTGNTPRGQQAKTEDVPTPEEIKMGAVKSPYKACQGVVIVERSERPTDKAPRGGRTKAQIEWDEKAEFWKNYPGKGCDAAKVNCTRKVEFIPDTHFYKSFDGRPGRDNFTSKESANDFLKRVADTSVAKAKARIEALKAKKACVESPNPTCQKDIDKLLTDLKAKIPEFRRIVGRINEQSSKYLYSGSGSLPRNGKIIITRDFHDAEGKMIVPKNMPPLTDKEYSGLATEMDGFLAEAFKAREAEVEAEMVARKMTSDWEKRDYREAVMGNGKSTGWIIPKFVAAKEKNVAEYNKLLAAYPELGYMNEADLAPKEMAKKFALAIKDAEETMGDMKNAGDAVSSTPGEVNKKRMGFAAHTQTIEEILAKEGDGRSCAVANATLNELATVKTKEGAIVGGLTVVTSVGLGVAGAVIGKGAAAGLVAMMGSSAAAVGNTLGALAFATGAVAGFGMTAHEVSAANDTIRDAKVGLVKIEDATKAIESKNISLAMGILNFQGGSAYIGAAVGVGIGAVGAGTKVLLSSVLKNGAKGGGGPAVKEAEALAANIVKANAGDATAQKAVLAVAAAQEKAVLGKAVAADDRKAFDAIAASGVAGTAENPDPAVMKAAVDNLAGMQGPNKAAYTEAVVELRKSTPAAKGDAAREAAANRAIVDVAGVVPTAEAKKILADPAWDAPALTGWAAVVAKMKEFKGSTEEKFAKAWEVLRVKAGLAKEKVDDVLGRCRCGGICPMPKVAGPYDGNPWGEIESKIVACAAPLPTTL